MISPIYYIAVAVCIMFSGFFSATEMAYSSANRLRLENTGENGNRAAALACKIYDNYDNMLSSVLILNNLVNVGASSIVSIIALSIARQYNFPSATTLATICITLLIIIFGETIPKIVAKKNANKTAASFAYVVRGLMFILKPLVFIVVTLIHFITKPLKGEKPADEQETAVEELFSIIETVEDEGVIDEERSELLQAALDFSEISASEVMTSRVDMVSIDIDDDWDEILKTIDNSSYSRLPVYEDSIDNIIGILYLNHFFKAITGTEKIDLRPLLIKPCYVYKTVKLPSVLAEMRKSRTHLAIVTDEYGGSMGVVTMEDVLEELVGDIWDETDEFEPEVIEHGKDLYELDGDMNISDFLEMIDRSEDSFETDSATVGGWTIESFGRFPECGESFKFENLTVTVLEVYGQRVEKVLLLVE
ncbi:MAG: HlyC/CorC family transporter [Oscillospiraceae bacterium]|nr:HlyC/CorC family transporter [Oscillospiraceae bacterium]